MTQEIWMPEVCELKSDHNTVELELFIPESLQYFAGHFPGNPVLPGVVQVDWIMILAKEYLNMPGEFQGMEVLKFRKVIGPNTRLKLAINYNPDKQKITFIYESSDNFYSKGRIVLG